MSPAAWVALTLLIAPPPTPIDFDTQIVPVLTKAGCNAGACHGAAAGRGGFHLSLLGSDPAADYESIMHQFEGRRINLVHPESSLILRKPTGKIDHGGSVVLEEASTELDLLVAWIEAGANRGPKRELVGFEAIPLRQTFSEIPASAPIKVRARFDDGEWQDVTHLALITSTDPSAVMIDGQSQAKIKRRGQHTVIVRFLDQVVALQFEIPLSDTPVDLSQEQRSGFLDEAILEHLSDLRVPLSPDATDEAWLRRVSLDLTGRLPEPDQVADFLSDPRPDRRERQVDSLLASQAFVDYWTLQFARQLRLHSLPKENEGLEAYTQWLRSEIAKGTSLDEMARQLLLAVGDSHVIGPANFGRMVPDARAHAELVGQFFLGMKLGCANCHNHPLDRWTQDDYHGLAAVFAKVDRGRNVQLTQRGAVTNLRTNQPAVPRVPGLRDLTTDGDHREAILDWVLSAEQTYFARATVNRLWRSMFGRGLVDPTDDLRQTNPATHPELLERLTRDFVDHQYSFRHTLRLIATSRVYARSDSPVPGNEADDRFYSRAYRRPLSAEILADAISDVLGVYDEFEGKGKVRSVTIVDPLASAPSLDILGRCNRISDCSEADENGLGIPKQLHLINGGLINSKLTDKNSRLQRLIETNKSDQEIVDEFYLRGLGRHPTGEELERWCERLATSDQQERRLRLEDFVWSLLNSRDFQENH